MKAIRTKEGQARNPVFSVSDKRKALVNGESYDVPEFITLPVGQAIDCPDAWRLCVKGVAVADDDECRAKFFAYIGDPGRKAIVEQIFLLRTAAATTRLSEVEQKHLTALEKAYAVDLGIAEGKSDESSAVHQPTRGKAVKSSSAGISGDRPGSAGKNAEPANQNETGSQSGDDGTNHGGDRT